jgi:hypothetical protein
MRYARGMPETPPPMTDDVAAERGARARARKSDESSSTGARWVIVVQDPELAAVFRQRFAGSGVVVVLDQRRAERRQQGGAAPTSERREADRRQRKAVAWVYPIQRPAGPAPDARQLDLGSEPALRPIGPVAETCPECGIAVEFKMPHFDPAPDRVETTVVHRTDQTFGVQHDVEVKAFASNGSPLPKRRVQAQRRMPRR